jgi:hypothetical protein
MEKILHICYDKERGVIGRLLLEYEVEQDRDEIVRSLLRSLKFTLGNIDDFVSIEQPVK